MNRHFPIIQGYVFVARLGGAVTVAAAPAHDSAAWLKTGETTNGELNVEVETKERTKIELGKRIKISEVVSENFTLKATIEELNKLVIDLIFGSDTTNDNAFIAAGAQGRKAWVRFQGYDQGNTNRILLQGLVLIKPSGAINLAGEEFFKADFDMMFEGRPTGSLIGAYA